jgi:DNA-binding transcriptional ArsR family regulator
MRDDTTGFDPAQDVRLDTAGLRVLAHPLRVRMLGRLRLYGPATPSQLARDLGESSGATSYHLRQLLAHGFVVEEADKGTKRERWYRSAHRTTYYDMKLNDENS